jgi:hypothetical protein
MVNGRRNLRRLNAVTFTPETSVIYKLLCLFIDRQIDLATIMMAVKPQMQWFSLKMEKKDRFSITQ